MRRLWGLLLAALISTGAHAQTTARVGYAADGNGSQPFTYVSSITPLPVSGSFSAGSFAPGGSFANLTSTASSADAALPTGTTVALFNTGTSAVSCTLTVGAGSSTSNKNIIQPGSWFAVVPGSNTHYSCINQAGDSASNVVVASGGSGLPAGAGGGGSTGTSAVNISQMGGTTINSGCVGALSGFSAAVPSTVCGVFGVYVINAQSPGAHNIANSLTSNCATDQCGQTYNTIAASQTAQALTGGGGGATGDYLGFCTIYPTSTSPGVLTVFDNTSTAANNAIAFAGGASSLSNLTPINIPVGSKSVNGPWKVTTGANMVVTCNGHFT